MNAVELREAIKVRLQNVREKCIWERAVRLMSQLGRLTKEEHKENRYWGYCTNKVRMLGVTVEGIEGEGRKLKIQERSSSTGTGGHEIKIWFNGMLVFDAQRVHDPDDYPLGKELMTTVGGPEARITIMVLSYIPGEWVEWLDKEKILKLQGAALEQLMREARDAQTRNEAEALEREKKRPLTETEKHLAESFGIAV
ncbi:MAG: hypothetical protein HYW90_03890 [Candidatus Sungbacteria bacterium]|nr:hypothetical protein [Candidatus Sungbacteria bacterium]